MLLVLKLVCNFKRDKSDFFFQDGKNHVTFPEFQQNGSAKQFTHGKKKYYRLGT